MITLTVQDSFDAAHSLEGMGKCEFVHGHTYSVEVEVGRNGDWDTYLMDLRDLKELVHQVLDNYDHCDLNSVFLDVPSSAENLALRLTSEIGELLPPDAFVKRLSVQEGSGGTATKYCPYS